MRISSTHTNAELREIAKNELDAHGDPTLVEELIWDLANWPETDEAHDDLNDEITALVESVDAEREIDTLEKLGHIVGREEGQTLWFLSMSEAEMIREAYDRKDMGMLMLSGIKPIAQRWEEVLAGLANMEEGGDWPTKAEILERADEIGWF